MAHSYTQITITDDGGVADKDNTEFSFDFEYINTGDIKTIVSLNPTADPPTWTTALPHSGATGDFDANGIDAVNKKIKLASSPNSSSSAVTNSAIRIYRSTTLNPIVDFQGGSRVAEADLDNAYRQGLFAAQEVSENAATTGGAAGALTTDSVDHQHIVVDAVRSAEIQANAVDTSEIAADAVEIDQIAHSLDFSAQPHTIILPTETRNLASEAANFIFQGPLRIAAGGTGLTARASSDVLEKITGQCDGTTVTRHPHSPTATFTLPNVTAIQVVSGASWQTVNGSSISFRPHQDATRVEYEFSFTLSNNLTAQALTYFRLMATAEGGASPVEVRHARFTSGGGPEWHGGLVHFKWVFGRYADSVGADAGVFGSAASVWDADRTLYLEVLSEQGGIPTISRRKVVASSAALSTNVLTVVTATDWTDVNPGAASIVKLDGTWATASTDPVGYRPATYLANNSFTVPVTGVNQSYSPGVLASVYSWSPSDHTSDVRLHTLPHFTDEDIVYGNDSDDRVRKPVLTVTSIK